MRSRTAAAPAAGLAVPAGEQWIEYVALEDLRPHPDNPKGHDIPLIRASIRRHGFVAPISVCERTGYIAAGHGRRAAMLAERGQDPDNPPRLVTRDADGTWRVPVARGWASENDAELMAYVLADNETSKAAGWVDDLLAPALLTVFQTPLGLDGTGFSKADLDRLAHVMGPADLPMAPASDAYREQYGVIVMCAGEDEQRAVYEQLTAQGMECRVVVT